MGNRLEENLCLKCGEGPLIYLDDNLPFCSRCKKDVIKQYMKMVANRKEENGVQQKHGYAKRTKLISSTFVGVK